MFDSPSTMPPAPCTTHPVPRAQYLALRNILFAIILLFSVSCITKRVVVEPRTLILPFGDTVHLKDGSLIYGLPQTVLDFEVNVEKRIEKPGPYARFAGDLLGIKDVINQEKETWAITGIKVHSSEELDPSEFYVIASNTLFQTNALALRKAGLILDLNPEIYAQSGTGRNINKAYDTQRGYTDMGANEYFVTQSDTAFKLVKLDTTFVKIPYLIEKKKQLTTDQLAEKAAKSLLELRDGRHQILIGETNVFPQGKAPIDEIYRLEQEYLALFAGKAWTETKKFTYSLIPRKDSKGKPITLFRFSPLTGPAESNGNSGIPVTVQLVPLQKTKDLTVVSKPVSADDISAKYNKLYYRVPELVSLDIKMGEEKLYNSRNLIYQFGQIVQLPANYIIGK